MTRTILTTVFTALAATAAAQTGDARWTPWIGCWETPQAAGGARVCVSRAGANAVTLTTTLGGQAALEQTITADGADHPVTEPDCKGTQRAEWSRDGQRLFAHADLACKDQMPRVVSGLTMIAPNGRWLDIQNVRLGDQSTIRVRRYRRITVGESPDARADAPLTLEAIKEMSKKVDPQVVDAALVETDAHFDLTSRSLIDLANAGVPPTLIDVMIAISYPQHFVVERTAQASAPPPITFGISDPFFYGDFYSAYFYSPFAYRYAGYLPWYAYGDGIYGGGGGVAPPPDRIEPSGQGKVVNGQGYTRVRPRDQSPAVPSDGSTGTRSTAASGAAATPQGYTRGASAPVADSSGGSSSSSGSSSSGSSSGGSSSSGSSSNSGSDTGRTAVPR